MVEGNLVCSTWVEPQVDNLPGFARSICFDILPLDPENIPHTVQTGLFFWGGFFRLWIVGPKESPDSAPSRFERTSQLQRTHFFNTWTL
eukprot:6100051-Amphidinium_carterae.1